MKSRDVRKTVTVDLDTIATHMGVDKFNDLLCDLTGEPELMEIGWEESPKVTIVVTGYVEEEEW